ncbi:MAG: protein translocase subunit SecD [Pseudobdellovibrio sp.]
MENLRLRTWIAGIALVLVALFILPNFVDTSKYSWWPASKLNYGLDIQGGIHLVMGVDVEGVLATTVKRQTAALTSEFEKTGIQINGYNTDNAKTGSFSILVPSTDMAKRVEDVISKNYPGALQIVSSNAQTVEVKYYDAYLLDQKQNTINQAIETIRNRIDEFGVAEPSITQQGADRILVQLPGMGDAEKAKQLVNTTAKLDFMLVNYEKSPEELKTLISEAEKAGNYSLETLQYNDYIKKLNEDLKGKLPQHTVVYFEKQANVKTIEAGATPFLLYDNTDLGGDALDNASVTFNQYGSPEVSLRFNSSGANKFADLTEKNTGRQMAVVLDKIVKTAPNINGKIPNGQAVITLGNSNDRKSAMDEAKLISMALRAGALPASLEQLEERRVGPSLGKDALQKAQLGALVGSLIVIIFMIVYYKGMGLITAVTLLLNVIAIFAILGSLGATLTLPGIAGMALTVGFAVDANVLINERIREELAKGAGLKSAIQDGYSHAMSAIIDSNVTTASTAIVLLYFGTGPVRGFAVTLLAGIATTIFANVFISKVITDNLVHRFGLKKISV